ncbi:MAG: hypothetical protein IPK97_13830 [Ahniella sp.]|nr:hypothetical protein [Ahniella sp.]
MDEFAVSWGPILQETTMRSKVGQSFSFVVALLAAQPSLAAVNVDYRNFDSEDREFAATCSGSRASIKFNRGTTGSATLQGSAPCVIKQGSEEVILNGGEDVEIKNGVIQIVD